MAGLAASRRAEAVHRRLELCSLVERDQLAGDVAATWHTVQRARRAFRRELETVRRPADQQLQAAGDRDAAVAAGEVGEHADALVVVVLLDELVLVLDKVGHGHEPPAGRRGLLEVVDPESDGV